MESAYPDVGEETERFRLYMADGYEIVDNQLIDPRLDRIEKQYVASTPTEEQLRGALQPIPRAVLEDRKPKLKAIDKEMDKTQRSIASIVTSALSQPASAFCKRAK
jgi:hypothetical protein